MRGIKCLLSFLVIIFIFLVTCAPTIPTPPGAVVDDLGRSVNIEKIPQRIVSLSPSNTEILFALGLGDKVVGVTDYCDYPAEAQGKEKVGGPWGAYIDVEKIIALNPDFILAAHINGEDVINTLAGYGFTVFGIKSTDLDDVLNDINTVGEITNREAEATALTTDMQNSIDAVTAETAGLSQEQKPRAFHICWHDPIYTSGNGTFIHDLFEKAGGGEYFQRPFRVPGG